MVRPEMRSEADRPVGLEFGAVHRFDIRVVEHGAVAALLLGSQFTIGEAKAALEAAGLPVRVVKAA